MIFGAKDFFFRVWRGNPEKMIFAKSKVIGEDLESICITCEVKTPLFERMMMMIMKMKKMIVKARQR